MIRAGVPKTIWDNALEFEPYVRSHKALDVYMLQGEVPETVISGVTSDIIQFCETWVLWLGYV